MGDITLEATKTYKLEIYADRIPIYLKLKVRKDKNPINIFTKIDDLGGGDNPE